MCGPVDQKLTYHSASCNSNKVKVKARPPCCSISMVSAAAIRTAQESASNVEEFQRRLINDSDLSVKFAEQLATLLGQRGYCKYNFCDVQFF
jgi:hypothetical protein